MKIWANSGDSHYMEPPDLYKALPPALAERMPRSVKSEDGTMETITAPFLGDTLPVGINNKSEIVGWGLNGSSQGIQHGFVRGGDGVGEHSRRSRRGLACDVDQVLDRHRDAVKRSAVYAAPEFGVGFAGGLPCPRCVDADEGVRLGAARVDGAQTGFNEIEARPCAGAKRRGRLRDRPDRSVSVRWHGRPVENTARDVCNRAGRRHAVASRADRGA